MKWFLMQTKKRVRYTTIWRERFSSPWTDWETTGCLPDYMLTGMTVCALARRENLLSWRCSFTMRSRWWRALQRTRRIRHILHIWKRPRRSWARLLKRNAGRMTAMSGASRKTGRLSAPSMTLRQVCGWIRSPGPLSAGLHQRSRRKRRWNPCTGSLIPNMACVWWLLPM